MLTYVLSADGSPLMQTYHINKVRQMLKDGRAVIAGHRPGFTIWLTYGLPKQDASYIQSVELCEDTGDHHIGVSVKSKKHEFAHEQYDLLPDEKKRRDDRRKYRRARRNRLRYRKPRFDNRRTPEGWFAPSIKNKTQRHVDIIKTYRKVLPLTSITLETARFDTQLLEAQQEGKTLPHGTDYQHGASYLLNNLREAVFTRDGYTCQVCGRSVKDGAILRVHHALYWKKDHTDRISGLLTVCTDCQTPKNHKPGGKLWGLTPKVKSMAGAAFMNAIRWQIGELCRQEFPDLEIYFTNGAKTKAERRSCCIGKTHANDAYCMGAFRPKHMAKEVLYKKRRRNNRILSKFYDAKYIDIRNGKTKSGGELGTNRTNRRELRMSDKNERIYRGQKVSKGRIATRRQRYPIQAGDVVLYDGRKEPSSGQHCSGTRVILKRHTQEGKQISVSIRKIKPVTHAGSWYAQ